MASRRAKPQHLLHAHTLTTAGVQELVAMVSEKLFEDTFIAPNATQSDVDEGASAPVANGC